MNFTHLHVHSQYSILDGASSINDIVQQAKDLGHSAIALTDHGNMYGAKKFFDVATKEGIKPILGMEAYMAKRGRRDTEAGKDNKSYHLILLAKNLTGYRNLIKLSSRAFQEGFYYKPRIDRELLEQHSEGLIVSSACLGGELPKSITEGTEERQDEVINWYKRVFGEDYYLEVMLHQDTQQPQDTYVVEKQTEVNTRIFELAEKHGVKVIATNDAHFRRKDDAEAHDRLICMNTGKYVSDTKRMRYSGQEYIKSTQEMLALFPDHPEVLTNTQEIVEKVETFDLNSKPIMPDFPLPQGFENEDDYLKFLAYKGAINRYATKEQKAALVPADEPINEFPNVEQVFGTLSEEVRERIDFELETVKKMGFPGYFLIVWDFIDEAKNNLGVWVGPGRGSAAGSAVAYSLGITDMDPIAFDLLFERFLNPDRISMPDVDIDFDEDGRELVLDYVAKKYGKEKVAHIITFGTIAAKSAIKDVARVEEVPLAEANRLAGLVPDKPGTTLDIAFKESPELRDEKEHGTSDIQQLLNFAQKLEGSVRQVGLHACGIIIGKEDLSNFMPMTEAKDAKLQVTQFDGSLVESVGMLKMDFLGLKTLSVLKDAVANIKRSKGIVVDMDKIPAEDPKAMQIYAKGDTVAIFQFESEGMRMYLRQLEPTKFSELVAMNALYRPGPMQYIDSFIKRKKGLEKIEYDHPLMEKYLENTYGITVFQEQVMLLSRLLAGFTRGDSDTLRKAMGKKQLEVMAKLKVKFDEGCKANPEFMNHFDNDAIKAQQIIDKIWNDWLAFAKYAFNMSHSVCYADVSYRTAYLKAHYPAEFLAAVLGRSSLEKLPENLSECAHMGVPVLGPDINESAPKFAVNEAGEIRYGFEGLKGLGEKAYQSIVQERTKNGPFKDVFDLVERVDPQAVNKRCLVALALSGSFDSFELPREIFEVPNGNGDTFAEELVRYAQNYKNDKLMSQASLFGNDESLAIVKPKLYQAPAWSNIDRLNKEHNVTGIYLSAHPLDDHKLVIDNYANSITSDFTSVDLANAKRKQDIKLPGIIKAFREGIDKSGRPYGFMTLTDYVGSMEFGLFGEDFTKFKGSIGLNYAVLLTCEIGLKWRTAKNESIMIKSIDLLSHLHDRIKTCQFQMPLSSITSSNVLQLKHLVEQHPGEVGLKIKLIDTTPEGKYVSLDLFSRMLKFSVNTQVLKELAKIPGMEYSISS